MKTAAERYDETAPTALGDGQFMLLRSQVIDMIEAAVAEERARCKKEASWAIHDCGLPRHEGNLHIRNLINRAVLQAIDAGIEAEGSGTEASTHDDEAIKWWKTCPVGSCHRHEACMYRPCRGQGSKAG